MFNAALRLPRIDWGLRDYGTATWEGGDENCNHNPQTADGGERNNRTLPLGRGGVYKDMCKCGAKRIDNQLGLEKTPEEYVAKMIEVFREVKRVLKKEGTCWLNLGDTYSQTRWSDSKGTGSWSSNRLKDKNPVINIDGCRLEPKNLVGIPWRVAFALQADGWYLRQDIIWAKPNPMPESVTDRCTKAHEYIFLLSKKAKYYYNNEAIRENIKSVCTRKRSSAFRQQFEDETTTLTTIGRNKRSVWTVTTKPYKEAHFATFPIALIEPCILAGTDKGDTILDPFFGAGTTGVAAYKHDRKFVGIELNPEYVEIAAKRIEAEASQLKLWR